MNGLAGHLAVADAMTRAGNFAAARSHVGRALELDPTSPAAHRTLFEIELQSGSPRACLSLAEAWLELDPTRPDAHSCHLVALCNNRKMREARKKLDALAERFVESPRMIAEMRLYYAHRYGSPGKTIRDVEALRETFGDDPWLDRMDLAARFRARRIFSVPEAARKVLANTPDYADAHLMLAITAFRRGQFARARHHAHDFMRTDPAWASMGREIILATRLVWFPPFLVTHLLLRLARSGGALEGPGLARRVIAGIPIVLAFGLFVAYLVALGSVEELLMQASAPELLLRFWIASGPAWFLYESFIFPRMGALLSGRRRPVRLDADY